MDCCCCPAARLCKVTVTVAAARLAGDGGRLFVPGALTEVAVLQLCSDAQGRAAQVQPSYARSRASWTPLPAPALVPGRKITDDEVAQLRARYAGNQADRTAAAAAASSSSSAAPAAAAAAGKAGKVAAAAAAGGKEAKAAAGGKKEKGTGAAAGGGKGGSKEPERPADISRLDLRVGFIRKAWPHPDAERCGPASKRGRARQGAVEAVKLIVGAVRLCCAAAAPLCACPSVPPGPSSGLQAYPVPACSGHAPALTQPLPCSHPPCLPPAPNGAACSRTLAPSPPHAPTHPGAALNVEEVNMGGHSGRAPGSHLASPPTPTHPPTHPAPEQPVRGGGGRGRGSATHRGLWPAQVHSRGGDAGAAGGACVQPQARQHEGHPEPGHGAGSHVAKWQQGELGRGWLGARMPAGS